MKTYNLILTVFLILLISRVCYSQNEDVYISEGEMVSLCGKNVVLDGIWLKGGIRMADISILESKNSKPITGGYKNHDSLQLNQIINCTYYIHDIYKKGILSKGVVVISNKPAETMLSVMQSIFSLSEGEDIFADNKYIISKIRNNKEGKPAVQIKISREDLDTTVVFQKGDILWSEGFPFALTEISVTNKTCEFDKMENYQYKTGDVIKGEGINKPVNIK